MKKNILYIYFTCFLSFFITSNLSAQELELIEPDKFIAGIIKPLEIPIDFALDLEDDDNYPSHDLYQTWQNEKANPYKLSIKDLPDSIEIDLSEYFHPTKNIVTSNYGPRGRRFHHGIDLRVKVGDDIHAAFDGKIRVTGLDPRGYGKYVVIRHDNGLETLYGHLSTFKVVPNQVVKAGDVIGLGGNTGRSTGPHLHFELRLLGVALNPSQLIDFKNYVPYKDTYLVCKKTSFKELIAFQRVRYHIVRPGDTLSGIAKRYGVSVNRLCQLNRIGRNSIIRPKQRIRYT